MLSKLKEQETKQRTKTYNIGTQCLLNFDNEILSQTITKNVNKIKSKGHFNISRNHTLIIDIIFILIILFNYSTQSHLSLQPITT